MEKTRRLGLAAAVTLAVILALAATVGLDGRRDQGTPARRPAAIIGGEDAPCVGRGGVRGVRDVRIAKACWQSTPPLSRHIPTPPDG